MERLTENDRGTFLVTTQGSIHRWEITDEGVFVTRNPDMRDSKNPFGMDSINGRRNEVISVEMWPAVGVCFMYTMYGDMSWVRSSRIRSICQED